MSLMKRRTEESIDSEAPAGLESHVRHEHSVGLPLDTLYPVVYVELEPSDDLPFPRIGIDAPGREGFQGIDEYLFRVVRAIGLLRQQLSFYHTARKTSMRRKKRLLGSMCI